VRKKSVFIFACLCGREFQKEGKESFPCPDCGRMLILEWRVEVARSEWAERAVSREDNEHAYATNR
jgi:predicted RNA-binding Zn-ribbon protein involved in translation (DUF1610 family)